MYILWLCKKLTDVVGFIVALAIDWKWTHFQICLLLKYLKQNYSKPTQICDLNKIIRTEIIFCNNVTCTVLWQLCVCYDIHSKLRSIKADHALICLSIVIYLKDYRCGCEELKLSIWYVWPHQCGVFVWVVFGSTRHGHYWAGVCDSAVTGQSSWTQLLYALDKQIKNNKK